MSSEGPKSGTSFSSVTPGVVPWVSPIGATASDNQYANATLVDLDSNTEGLDVTGFNFSAIPDASTIDGVLVEIEKSETLASIVDETVRLIVAGTVAGDNKASFVEWPLADAYSSYGGAADTWGLSLTTAQVKAGSSYGVQVRAVNTSGATTTARVDHVRMTVYYTFLGVSHDLSSVVPCAALVAGALTVFSLVGRINCVSSLAGFASADYAISGSAACSSVMSGEIDVVAGATYRPHDEPVADFRERTSADTDFTPEPPPTLPGYRPRPKPHWGGP